MSNTETATDDMPRVNGMPMLGLGTWQNDDDEECAESVATALEAGYRHIDTAQAYGNEAAVGAGIEEAGVDRDDVFLATKVWADNLAHDDVISSTEESLEKLGVDAVDLLYVHWPKKAYDPEDTMSAFDELHDDGKIHNVGVSNFEPHHVETAMDALDAPLFANQVEMHPLLPQTELRRHADEHDYQMVAYSPLARGAIMNNATISGIADSYDVSEAQVSLAWLREKGVTAIPKATGREHILDNLASLDLRLDDADVERIDDIDEVERQVDPDFAPDAW